MVPSNHLWDSQCSKGDDHLTNRWVRQCMMPWWLFFPCYIIPEQVSVISTNVVGFVLMPAHNGVTSWDVSSSAEERVPFLEYAEAVLITGEQEALSPQSQVFKGGTFWVLSVPVYKSRTVQISSVLSALVSLRRPTVHLQTHLPNHWKLLWHILGSLRSIDLLITAFKQWKQLQTNSYIWKTDLFQWWPCQGGGEWAWFRW